MLHCDDEKLLAYSDIDTDNGHARLQKKRRDLFISSAGVIVALGLNQYLTCLNGLEPSLKF